MSRRKHPRQFLQKLESVTGKRARLLVDLILEQGSVTTEELARDHGYDHPPRAARDVREQGIPLETFYVKNSQGRRIGAYRFGDPSKVRHGRLAGRKVLPKKLKTALIEEGGATCAICLEQYDARFLQVDHRIPYEVSGESEDRALEEFMLACRSCNRAKSWSCEHCPNWLEERNATVCRSCYWASPASYKHIALQRVRRLDVVWTEAEIETYDKLKRRARTSRKTMPEYVKRVVRHHLEQE